MADNTTVFCDVNVAPDLLYGAYANAFRILPENGAECFLDFCVFSAESNTAKVVARLRVHVSFLAVIQERLDSTMKNLGQVDGKPEFIMTNGVLRNGENQVVLFGTTSIEQ